MERTIFTFTSKLRKVILREGKKKTLPKYVKFVTSINPHNKTTVYTRDGDRTRLEGAVLVKVRLAKAGRGYGIHDIKYEVVDKSTNRIKWRLSNIRPNDIRFDEKTQSATVTISTEAIMTGLKS